MNLFDTPPETLDELRTQWEKCTKCFFSSLHKDTGPCLPTTKKGEIIVVGQWPGMEDMKNGIPFSGKQGQITRNLLADVGFPMNKVVFTNVLLCACPLKPTKTILSNCHDQLDDYITLIDPVLIIALGTYAIRRFGIRKGISEARGKLFTYMEYPVIGVTHTAAIDRATTPQKREEIENIVREDLQKALFSYERLRSRIK